MATLLRFLDVWIEVIHKARSENRLKLTIPCKKIYAYGCSLKRNVIIPVSYVNPWIRDLAAARMDRTSISGADRTVTTVQYRSPYL